MGLTAPDLSVAVEVVLVEAGVGVEAAVRTGAEIAAEMVRVVIAAEMAGVVTAAEMTAAEMAEGGIAAVKVVTVIAALKIGAVTAEWKQQLNPVLVVVYEVEEGELSQLHQQD